MSKRVAEAERMFAEGFTCSQSVFGAFAEDLGLEKHMALKLANGFGGGIARRQEVCGAVSGAVMLIGLKLGKTTSDDTVAHDRTYCTISMFYERFTEMNGAATCREILGCDIAKAKESNLFETTCRKCVHDAAALIEELLMTE